MTTPTPGPAIDYSSRDFDGYRASMMARAVQLIPEWKAGDEGDFLQVLIELLAWMGDNLAYYVDRAATESFLPTAQIRSNVLAQAKMLGYRPAGRVASKVTLQLTAPDAATDTIPPGTQFTTAPMLDRVPLVFETDESVTFGGGIAGVNQQQLVPATQGISIADEAVAVSTGIGSQYYGLYRSPVIDSTVRVWVQDNPAAAPREWTYVDHLIEAGPNDEVFSTDTSSTTGTTLLLFGNNVTGKVPARGATITASYRIGGGLETNVAAGTITQMVDPMADIIAVTNPAPATGGQDEESTESVRANAPFVFGAQNRAFNADDFKGLALRVPGVGKAKAQSSVYTNWVVYVAPANGDDADEALLAQVTNFIMDGRALVGWDVRAASVVYVPVDITVLVDIYEQYNRESVRTAVSNALGILFDFTNPYGVADFGVDVTQGAIYTLVMAVEGVRSCQITLLAYDNGTGVADLAIEDWQIATLGASEVDATGGIASLIPMVDVTSGNPLQPGLAGAPAVTLTRCDTSTTRVEANWAAATDATLYYVELSYMDGSGGVMQTTTFGPYTATSFGVDAPKVTAATSLRLRIRSFNGTTGPSLGAYASVANPCYTP